MKAPRRPFPTFTLAMSQDMDFTFVIPLERPSQVFRYQPYPPVHQHTCASDDEDLVKRTVNRGVREPTFREPSLGSIRFASTPESQEDEDNSVIRLRRAIHSAPHGNENHNEASARMRRISMTTLVIDLALAIKHKMARLHATKT